MTESQINEAIAAERAPAQKRADRIKEVAAALLAGPGPEERAKLEAEMNALKAQRHERPTKLQELLAQRRAVRRAERERAAKSAADMGDLSGKSDAELTAMRARIKADLDGARAKLATLGAELSRRQSLANARARIKQLGREELLATRAAIDAQLAEAERLAQQSG